MHLKDRLRNGGHFALVSMCLQYAHVNPDLQLRQDYRTGFAAWNDQMRQVDIPWTQGNEMPATQPD